MEPLNIFFRWSWLIGIALVIPVALPAGGIDTRHGKIRHLYSLHTTVAGEDCNLRTSPVTAAPVLTKLKLGTPLKVVRIWECQNQQQWLQGKVSSNPVFDFYAANRGWIQL